MTAFRKGRLQGLSCLKGNFHEQFLGGWAGAIPPGYPADATPERVNAPYSTDLSAWCRYTAQHVAAVGRRVSTLCKGEDGVRQQLALYHMYYNFCLPHASVRQPLPQPLPTNGSGSAKWWRPQTPAMAAGLTDHVWTLRAVLLFRVPPWPQPAGL